MLKSAWLLVAVVGLALLTTASASGSSPRELKALKAALKKQQRAKELRAAASKTSASVVGTGEYVPESGPWSAENEPSCEQLREMWRQSKRHSRAAETTNEIPQYADPFARAAAPLYGSQWAALLGEATLRPRPERRPVVYGRPMRHPPASGDGENNERSPLDALRREALQEHDASAFVRLGVDPSTGVVLSSEDDRSPFPKASAKGQFNNLRDFVRQEGASGSAGGAYERLRDVVRQEKGRTRGDWTDTDVGRVVLSPSDYGGKQASLYSMQSDAPYEGHGRRTSTSNRLAAFFGSQKTGALRNSKLIDDEPSETGRMRAFQLRDPPRQRVGGGQQHRTQAKSRLAPIDPEDQGVVRSYVVGRNSNPFYSRPSRRSSSPIEEYQDGELCGLEAEGVCRRNADCRCLVRLYGPQSSLLTLAKCKRARCLAAASKSGPKASAIRDVGSLPDAPADDYERQQPGEEDDAVPSRTSDVSQLIRALRLDDDDEYDDDVSTDSKSN